MSDDSFDLDSDVEASAFDELQLWAAALGGPIRIAPTRA